MQGGKKTLWEGGTRVVVRQMIKSWSLLTMYYYEHR